MPCHHKLEGYPDAYIKAAGVANGRKGPLNAPFQFTAQVTEDLDAIWWKFSNYVIVYQPDTALRRWSPFCTARLSGYLLL